MSKPISIKDIKDFERLFELVAAEGINIICTHGEWRAVPAIEHSLGLWVSRREYMASVHAAQSARDALSSAVDVLINERTWRIEYV